jgi:hypothetical protein
MVGDDRTREDRAARMEWSLRILVVAVSVFVMLLFVVSALKRLRYPYELEELEGYVFLTALRAFHGQSVYPHPSMAFIPYMYSPGYYYVAAALGRVMGMTMATMRMTSALSTLGCFAAIYTLVWSEVKKQLPAIAAAGLYAGCYTICQEWFDLGRLDSLFIFLVLLAMYATRRLHPVIAAVMWALAFQTKQSILPAAFVMLCCSWGSSRDLRRTLTGIVTLAVLAGGSVAWLNHATQGWYSFIVFTVPGSDTDIKLRRLALFWPEDMLRPLALALIVIAAAAILTRPSLRNRATRFYLGACSMVPLFWWIRAHGGSTVNSLMPVYALVAVLFGISLARLLAWLPNLADVEVFGGVTLPRASVLLMLCAALGQEAAGVYNPGDYLPATEVRNSIAAVVDQVRSVPGDVLVLQHPYYVYLAGKPAPADLVSIRDAMRPKNSPDHVSLSGQLRSELQAALAEHRYQAILFETPESTEELDKVLGGDQAWQSYYGLREEIPGVRQGTRPDWLLEHCAGPPCTK